MIFLSCTRGRLRQIFYAIDEGADAAESAVALLSHSTSEVRPSAVYLAPDVDERAASVLAQVSRACVGLGAGLVFGDGLAPGSGLDVELDRVASQRGWTERVYAGVSSAQRHVARGPTMPLDASSEAGRVVAALRSALPARRRTAVVVGLGLGDGLVSRAVFELEQHLIAFEPDRERVEAAAAWLQLRGFRVARPS